MLSDDEYQVFLKAFGTRIRQLRKDKKLNMRDIMISTGYYDSQWRKYEAGGSMNVQSLMKIALALDVSLIELFDGLGQWPKLSVAEIEKQHSNKTVGRGHLQPELPDFIESDQSRGQGETETFHERSKAAPPVIARRRSRSSK